VRFCENLTKIERGASAAAAVESRSCRADEVGAREGEKYVRTAAFRRSGRGKGMEKAAAPSDEGASEAICGANRRRAPSGGRRSENGIAAFSMPRYFAVWLTPQYINSADSVQRRARPAFGEAESSKGGQALPDRRSRARPLSLMPAFSLAARTPRRLQRQH